MIRKNISLYEGDMKGIERIVEKHGGNFSAAIREIIDFADFALRKFGSFEEAREIEKRIKGVCLPNTLLSWFLACTREGIPDEVTTGGLEEMHTFKSVSDLSRIADLGFAVDIKVDADDDQNPAEVTICVFGERMHVEFVAKIAACFLSENKGMAVEDVSRCATSTTVKLKRVEKGEEGYKRIREGLIKHFGERHIMMQEISNKPQFWNSVITATAEWGDVERYKYPKLYALR